MSYFVQKITSPIKTTVRFNFFSSATKTVGGIVLPDVAKAKTNEAKVVAVGKGLRNPEGKFAPPAVEVGDLVMIPEFRGDDVKINGEDFILIREEDLLAKIEHSDLRPTKKTTADIPDMRDLPKS